MKVKFKGVLQGTASWAKVLDDGRIELEYFDYSEAAQEHFGNDVAWMFRVDAAWKPRLYELLGVSGDEAMLSALVRDFEDVFQVSEWLRTNEIPFEKEFDSWA